MIRIERNGGLLKATLNRPEKANSLTGKMLHDLISAVRDARRETNVLVITGAGKVFSAGADLDEARAGLATSNLWEDLSGALADLPCLTVAALNGTLAGGAFGIALACDLRIATEGASFFYPVMKLGFLPQPSDPVRMARLIGPARAKMILMAGQKIPAETALSWGLVDQVVARDELETVTMAIAADALAAPRKHVAAIKALFEPYSVGE